MRFLVIVFFAIGIGLVAWLVAAKPEEKKQPVVQQTLPVSKHSEAFNNSIATILSSYDKLTEAFVNWDSVGSVATANSLSADFDKIEIDELKKDDSVLYLTALSAVENAKGNLQTIASEKGIRQQREAFNYLTGNIQDLLNTVKYDRAKVYLQECPMAFDDTEAAQWLSKQDSIRNPYLGLHHPTYGRGMLHCGEVKTIINHTGVK